MINNVNSPSFGSTKILLTNAQKQMTFSNFISKYMGNVQKSYELKGFFGEPQKIAKKLKNNQANIIINKDYVTVTGNSANDKVISNLIKENCPNAQYTNDVESLNILA